MVLPFNGVVAEIRFYVIHYDSANDLMSKYCSEEEIVELVNQFEAGTIKHAEWKHAEHLTVALYYLTLDDLETATDGMRAGLYNLLPLIRRRPRKGDAISRNAYRFLDANDRRI